MWWEWCVFEFCCLSKAIYTAESWNKNLLTIRFPFIGPFSSSSFVAVSVVQQQQQQNANTFFGQRTHDFPRFSFVFLVEKRFIVIHVERQSQTLDSNQFHRVFLISFSPFSFSSLSIVGGEKNHAQRTPNDIYANNYSINGIFILDDAVTHTHKYIKSIREFVKIKLNKSDPHRWHRDLYKTVLVRWPKRTQKNILNVIAAILSLCIILSILPVFWDLLCKSQAAK